MKRQFFKTELVLTFYVLIVEYYPKLGIEIENAMSVVLKTGSVGTQLFHKIVAQMS